MAQRPHLGLLVITRYLIFSIIFWSVGVLPDLATLRDRSERRLAKDLRCLRARLAGLRAALAPLSQASGHARSSGDAAGLLGAFDCRARLRGEPDAGLA